MQWRATLFNGSRERHINKIEKGEREREINSTRTIDDIEGHLRKERERERQRDIKIEKKTDEE